MLLKTGVFVIPTSAPNDVSGLQALVASGDINPRHVVAILGKTEGNGCVNDFTRGYAVDTLRAYLASLLALQRPRQDVVMVMSGGTEGVLSPHITVFTREPATAQEEQVFVEENHDNRTKGLAIGTFRTRDLKPHEIGTMAMVHTVADGVRAAMRDAHITTAADVHYCQIKCPLLLVAASSSSSSTNDQPHPHTHTRTTDPYKSMAYSRGAAALGVALAMGEIDSADIHNDDDILHNWDLYSSVASTSAGVELQNCEIILLGNARTFAASDYVIGHDVMQHALDQNAVRRATPNVVVPSSHGLVDSPTSSTTTSTTIHYVLAKAEADPSGRILQYHRHTMLDDSDISHTRMARAVVGAVVAAAVQSPLVYVSGGAEHQGPPGGGPIAVIVRRNDNNNNNDWNATRSGFRELKK